MSETPKFNLAELRRDKTENNALIIELNGNPNDLEITAIKAYLSDLVSKNIKVELIINTNGFKPLGIIKLFQNRDLVPLLRNATKKITIIGNSANIATLFATSAANLVSRDTISYINLSVNIETTTDSTIHDIEKKPVSQLVNEYIRSLKKLENTGPFSTTIINYLATTHTSKTE